MDPVPLRELRQILTNPSPTEEDSRRAITLIQENQWPTVILLRAFDIDMPKIVAAAKQRSLVELLFSPYVILLRHLSARDEQVLWDFLFVQLCFQEDDIGIILNFLPLIPDDDGQEFGFFDYIKDPEKHREAILFLMLQTLTDKPLPEQQSLMQYYSVYAPTIGLDLQEFSRLPLPDSIKEAISGPPDQEALDQLRNTQRSRIDVAEARNAVKFNYVAYRKGGFFSTQMGREMVREIARMKPAMPKNEMLEIILRYFDAIFS